MSSPTREQIRSIIAECAGVEIERVVPEARLVDLGIQDWPDLAMIAIDVEDAFRIGAPEGEEDSWHTVSDIYETVERLISEEER